MYIKFFESYNNPSLLSLFTKETKNSVMNLQFTPVVTFILHPTISVFLVLPIKKKNKFR